MLYEIPCQLDADGVRSCRERIEKLALAGEDLVLDLSVVTKMDSSGLGLLVLVHKRKLEAGHRLGIQNVSGEALELLTRFDLLSVFGYVKPEFAVRPVREAVAA